MACASAPILLIGALVRRAISSRNYRRFNFIRSAGTQPTRTNCASIATWHIKARQHRFGR
jgi:hypothetical protein